MARFHVIRFLHRVRSAWQDYPSVKSFGSSVAPSNFLLAQPTNVDLGI